MRLAPSVVVASAFVLGGCVDPTLTASPPPPRTITLPEPDLCSRIALNEDLDLLFDLTDWGAEPNWGHRSGNPLVPTYELSARGGGGRVILMLHGSLEPGALPRTVQMPAGCGMEDRLWWEPDEDHQQYRASARLEPATPPVTDAGIELTLSRIQFWRPDGGVEDVSDLHVQIALDD